jgi:hypothetical protein
LWHHAVIGGYNEHSNICALGAARPHGGERLVTRGIQEGDLASFLLDLIGAYVLSDPTHLTGRHISRSDFVEQAGLAVINVAQNATTGGRSMA